MEESRVFGKLLQIQYFNNRISCCASKVLLATHLSPPPKKGSEYCVKEDRNMSKHSSLRLKPPTGNSNMTTCNSSRKQHVVGGKGRMVIPIGQFMGRRNVTPSQAHYSNQCPITISATRPTAPWLPISLGSFGGFSSHERAMKSLPGAIQCSV